MNALQRAEHSALGTGASLKARALEVITVAAGQSLSKLVSA